MAICWNSYRHHLPTSLTDITYRHHLPTSLTDISYLHLLPTMVFQHSKTSRLPTFTYLLWFFSIQKPVVSSYILLFISHMWSWPVHQKAKSTHGKLTTSKDGRKIFFDSGLYDVVWDFDGQNSKVCSQKYQFWINTFRHVCACGHTCVCVR